MTETSQPHLIWRLKSWQTILLFSTLLLFVTTVGTFFFDFFAGTATVGFGEQPAGEMYEKKEKVIRGG